MNNKLSQKSGFTMKKVLIGMALTVASASLYADWSYLGAYNSSSGAPSSLSDMSSKLPANLLTNVNNRLPEGVKLSSNATSYALLTDDTGANIPLIADASIKVSYVTEGAGYTNAVGYFTFPKDNLTTLVLNDINQTEKIMFPNFSSNVLSYGKAVSLVNPSNTADTSKFKAGQAIGFTIVSNGWQRSYGRVNPSKPSTGIFRSIKRLNPEGETNNLYAHTVLMADPEHELLVLAFEDLNRKTCSANDYGYCTDDDFNDVIIAIHVSPFSAVDTGKIVDITTGTVTKTPISGVKGPASFREVSTPETVTDPIKAAAEEIMKANNAKK